MSAYIPRQLATSWDTFKMYLSKGFPSCRIGLRTQNSNKYIKKLWKKRNIKNKYMKNNNDNINKVNRKIKQINKVKFFKKTISKYVPLSSVTIDIAGQHYKKRA